ncbi:MAG: epimerase [Leptospiraceae bacterium]|nr:epimerase [Leptospiraceae bacterium]
MKVIILGATGMVGEGVLLECLENQEIKEILVIGRRTCGRVDPKLTEIIHSDMYDLSSIADRFIGFDACFFSIGTTSFGKTEEEYTKLTHTLTLNFANLLVTKSKDLVFCFVSGELTDSSEKGSRMWARIKGKTENDLMKLAFKKVYAFRPGYMHPTEGQKNTQLAYKFLDWAYPALRKIFPTHVSTMKEVALAMIKSVQIGYEKQILEVSDIVELAKR